MFAIVNVDKNWGIGLKGDMLIHLKSDLKFFKEQTIHKTVLMGRKTYESLPGKKPLVSRRNIILTRSDLEVPGFEVISSMEEALALSKTMDPDDFVIMGGAEIYKKFLPYCEKAIITKIDFEYDDVDRYFPNLDELEGWELESESELFHDEQVNYKRAIYKHTKVKHE
ncbi:dihydrofolate reductase [Guggenheimella bovis]